MSIRAHHVVASLFTGAVVLSTLAWLGLHAPSAVATCSTGAMVGISTPAAGATMSGVQTITAVTHGFTAQPTSVTFSLNGASVLVIGQSTAPSGGTLSTGTDWTLSWDSHGAPDGSYNLTAIAHMGTQTTYDCPSSPSQVYINNATGSGTQTPTLTANIYPISWQGLPGAKAVFSITGVYTNQFGVQYGLTTASGATFTWGTNQGTLSTNGLPSITLTNGTAVGTFSLGASVHMGGLTSTPGAVIRVLPPPSPTPSTTTNTPSPSPSPTPSPGASPSPGIIPAGPAPQVVLTPAQVAKLETTPTIFHPTAPTNSDPVVAVETLGCLEAKLGAAYAKISSGQDAASDAQRVDAATCFSGSDRIPATIAPIAPAHLTELESGTDVVQLNSIKNETIKNSKGDQITAILLSGTSTPNSSVFLYFFSDPMVLRAATDSSGKWSYVLENPLKPGSHEVYAVAQKDSSTFVRTPALPITIAAAASGSQDGSLIIEHAVQPVQIAYAGGAALMVIAAIFLLFRIRRRPKLATAGAVAPVPLVMPTGGPTTPTPVIVTPSTTPPPPTAPEPSEPVAQPSEPVAKPEPAAPAPSDHDIQA